MSLSHKEIERKFLIRKPDIKNLISKHHAIVSNIVQTYLKSDNSIEKRIRQKETNGVFSFFYTEKSTKHNIDRDETEKELTKDEYLVFLSEADETNPVIVKTRYCFNYAGQFFELDVYPDSLQAILEIELETKDTKVILPEFINVIKEVTGNDYYYNSSIAERGYLKCKIKCIRHTLQKLIVWVMNIFQ